MPLQVLPVRGWFDAQLQLHLFDLNHIPASQHASPRRLFTIEFLPYNTHSVTQQHREALSCISCPESIMRLQQRKQACIDA